MKQQEIAVSFICKNKVRSLISRNNRSLASDTVGVNYFPVVVFPKIDIFFMTLSALFLAVVCKSGKDMFECKVFIKC